MKTIGQSVKATVGEEQLGLIEAMEKIVNEKPGDCCIKPLGRFLEFDLGEIKN